VQYFETYCMQQFTGDESDLVTLLTVSQKQKKSYEYSKALKSCQYVCSGPVIDTLKNRAGIKSAKDDHLMKTPTQGDHI